MNRCGRARDQRVRGAHERLPYHVTSGRPPAESAYLNSSVFTGVHLPPWTVYMVSTLLVVSPNSSKATLPVTPSKLTEPSAVVTWALASSGTLPSFTTPFTAWMIAQ